MRRAGLGPFHRPPRLPGTREEESLLAGGLASILAVALATVTLGVAAAAVVFLVSLAF